MNEELAFELDLPLPSDCSNGFASAVFAVTASVYYTVEKSTSIIKYLKI
jgi:hypothetical protein